jgi:iron complex transport system ATP-binding protein
MKTCPGNWIQIDQAVVCSERRRLLNRLSARIRPGRFIGVIGPNGSGKSVLFQALTGQARLESGAIRMGGFSLMNWPAKKVSMFVAAAPDVTFNIPPCSRVGELVPNPRALALAAAEHLAGRRYESLNCPDRRRVQLGRALHRAIGEAPLRYLWLEDPDADLDPAHRIALMQALTGLAGRGLGIFCTLRHIELAGIYPDEVIVLREGNVLRQGPPRRVLTTEVVQAAAGFRLPEPPPPPAAMYPLPLSA